MHREIEKIQDIFRRKLSIFLKLLRKNSYKVSGSPDRGRGENLEKLESFKEFYSFFSNDFEELYCIKCQI